MSEQVSASHIHKLVLTRLYHEDQLLAQRTYNYLTFNVFLIAVLGFAYSTDKTPSLLFKIFIILLGAIVSVLQSAFGRRMETAIDFWRVYVKLIEQAARIPLDHLLFSFYETGRAETPFGDISKQESNFPIVFRRPPSSWAWMHYTYMLGVLLPFLIGTLWFFAAFVLSYKADLLCVEVSVGAAWLLAAVITWSKPASPQPSLPLGVSPQRDGEMLLAVIKRPGSKG